MQNLDVAHEFFYDGDGNFYRSSMTVSYRDNKFYSYATCIGELTKDINGNNVCIVSDDTFSSTTAKHLNALKSACPYDIYYLPTDYGNREFYVNETIKELIDKLEYYSKSKLTQKYNREKLTNTFNMLQGILQLEKFKTEHNFIKKILKKYTDIVQSVNNPEQLKHIKELQAKKEKQQKEKLKRELNKLFKKYSYLELLKFAYSDYWLNDFSITAYNEQKELKEKLRKYFNPKNEWSFVWFEDYNAKTSKHISVNRKETEALLKLRSKGKLKNGMKISYYTILEHNDKFVKIGCHKIPAENLKALLNSIELQKVA